jgi:hypothetical protein
MNEQETAPAKRDVPETGRRIYRDSRARLGALIAVAVAAGAIVVWLISSHGSSGPSTTPPVKPVALSADGLRTLAAAVGQPIYWAGERDGDFYELTRTSKNQVYIRYLPPGIQAGTNGGKYLVIATYPFANAYRALQEVAQGHGIRLPGGGLALVDQAYAKSVHLAFPNVDYQVEVYDPSPARARAVAASGRVQPVRR